MEKKGLEMVRSGEFQISTYGTNHCGTAEHFKIKYHLKCSCADKLDNRGFLFDQLNIQQYFESIKRTQLSCERLTVVCLQQLLRHILVENPVCEIHKMELTLSPEPFLASMTHSIETDDDKSLSLPKLEKDTTIRRTPSRRFGEEARRSHVKKHYQKMADRLLNVSGNRNVPNSAHNHKPSHNHYLFEEKTNSDSDKT